jgi:hypothetical protein
MAAKRRRYLPGSAAQLEAATSSTLQLPASALAELLATLWCEGPELLAEPDGADHVIYRWSLTGIGEMAVRLSAGDVDGRDFLRQARCDSHIGVEMEATLVAAIAADGIDDAFSVAAAATLTLGPDPWHPERHTPHYRAALDLLARPWHIATHSSGAAPTVLVDWQPLAVVEPGRSRHLSTVSLCPPFKQALTREAVAVKPATFLLRDPDHHNPEGNNPSLAHNARMRIMQARAPYATAREVAAAKGWPATATHRMQLAAKRLFQLAGINLERIVKRGRTGAWFDALQRIMPPKSRTTAPASPLLDTYFSIDAPPPAVGARPGPARASPAPA